MWVTPNGVDFRVAHDVQGSEQAVEKLDQKMLSVKRFNQVPEH